MRRLPLPTGRLDRTLKLARAGARSAIGWASSKPPEAVAAEAAEALGAMRGLATKVGQMMASLEGLMPPELREAAPALATLQTAAATSDPDEVRRVIEEDLDAPIEELFASFDPDPFASASIGQVHRAVLRDGTEVAVKVQHPGVAEALAQDLSNVTLVERFAGRVAARVGTKGLIEEVRARFLDELDQRLEADRQEQVRRAFVGDPRVRVPAVHPRHTGPRVLTTTFVRGLRIEEARDLPEATRAGHVEAIWRMFHGSAFRTGFLCADPHAGNLLLHEDGAVTFLDFGCVQPLEAATIDGLRALHGAATRGDEAAFEARARALIGGSDRTTEAGAELLRAGLAPEIEGITRVGDAHLARAGQALLAGKRAGVGPIARDTLPVWLPMYQRMVLTVLVHAWRLAAPFDARAAIAPVLLRQAKAA
jgi:predicted unusual protein kinase regulating ubiquinone biosynthesis (AarF/ABC1/UbiB family)